MIEIDGCLIAHGLEVVFHDRGPSDFEQRVWRTPWIIAELTTGTVLLRRPRDWEDELDDGADEGSEEILYFRNDHPALRLRGGDREVFDPLCQVPVGTFSVPVRYAGPACTEYFTARCPQVVRRLG